MAKYKRLQERFLQPAKTKEILSSAKKAQKDSSFLMISALSFLQQADQNNGNAALSALFLLFARKFIHLILSNLYFPVAIYHTWNVLSTELIPVCRTVGWFSPPKRSRQSGDAVFYRQQRLQLNAKQLAGVLACPIEQIL